MHRKHGNANVHGVYAEVADIHCDSSAAAHIYRAEFARLPYYSVVVEYVADKAHIFRGSVVGGRLAARARIFGYSRTARYVCRVAFFEYRAVSRVVTRRYVCGNALGVISYLYGVDAERIRYGVYYVRNYFTLHTRCAVASHFFFVGEYRKHGMGGITVENRFHFGICADFVVVTVSRDKRAVKAHVARLASGDEAKFRTLEVDFGNTVFLVEKL